MKKLLLTVALVLLGASAWAQIGSKETVADDLDCTVSNDAVTIGGEEAGSVTVIFPATIGGTCVITFEASVNGTNYLSVPATRYYGTSTAPVNHFEEATTAAAPATQQWMFLQPGLHSYRVRVSTPGTGNGTVTMNANAAAGPVDRALYFAGSQAFDLTIPSNTVTVGTRGASMLSFVFSSTLGASTVSFTTAGNPAECYALGSASVGSRTSVTGAINGTTWVCPLYGASTFTFTKDVGVGAGTPLLSFFVSMSGQVPDEDRAVSEWVAGSSPTNVTVGTPRQLVNPEGRLAVVVDHPRWFQCAMTSTATSSTVITTCSGAVATMAAPGAGLRFYITGFEYSSSIISTTANFMTLQSGTGGTCGTGTATLWVGSNVAAFSPREPALGINALKGNVNAEVCFLHPGAGTRWINVRGYVAP